MARYTGPKSKIARKFREPIFGPDKVLDRKNYPPGQHGASKRRGKQSEYAVQLMEKQKVKYTYGVLEKQFRNLFTKASARGGITGDNLLQLFGGYGYMTEYSISRFFVDARIQRIYGGTNEIMKEIVARGILGR